MKHDELDRVINDLKPVLADRLADEAYQRRPGAARVRARAGAPAAPRRTALGRRPALFIGATAVVTATAVLAASVVAGGHGGAGPGGPGGGGHGGPGGGGQKNTIDTRKFLLTSADTLAKQAPTHGTCWYTRTRMWHDVMPAKPGRRLGDPAHTGEHPAFQARTASSTEDWKCTLPGGTGMRFRTRSPLDIRVTFPTAKDKAAWRAAGSPPLRVNGGTTAVKPHTVTYDRGSHLVNPDIGSHEIEWRTLAKLPATKHGLERHLRKLWQEDRRGGANGYVAPADFGEYVFVTAWDLFMAPTTPGTRAALYRILADYPSVHATGRAKDREGRTGVTITAHGTDVQLVVDPATAQLLDFVVPGHPGEGTPEYLAFERQGWVHKIGTVPGS